MIYLINKPEDLMYLILCAMKDEVSEIMKLVKVKEHFTIFSMEYCRGSIGDLEVVTGMTGVGKVMSAIVTQKLSDMFSPEGIIFAGIAGAVNSSLDIGDIVVSADCMQHDMDASSVGFQIGEIPYTGIRILKADSRLLDAVKSYKLPGIKLLAGRILTGDQFISTASAEKRELLSIELGGDAVEMEGAAAAFAASINNIPFLIVRIISDKADGNAPGDFKQFLRKSSALLADIIQHILDNLDN
jgi:5'-methylthioadenosine/S-adenosylhomocysteine nucleosidase